jgi:hypothetical protein
MYYMIISLANSITNAIFLLATSIATVTFFMFIDK